MSNDWLETHTGVKFYPLNTNPQDVRIEDIAHALSNICRFNGHSSRFYSVGEHSINVQRELAARGANLHVQLIGLLHDAAEAYLCDVPSPIKPYLVGYSEIEKRLESVVFEAFSLFPTDDETAQVKAVDRDMLAWEAHQLMPCREWNPTVQEIHEEVLVNYGGNGFNGVSNWGVNGWIEPWAIRMMFSDVHKSLTREISRKKRADHAVGSN